MPETIILPHNLSPIGMFQSADLVVKCVMAGLIAASFISWVIWLAKTAELMTARRAASRSLSLSLGTGPLAELVNSRGPAGLLAAEISSEIGASGHGAQGLLDRARSRLAWQESLAARRANSGTGLLATIGSTAPFIGLFGTVWGIMNAFIGISQSQTTNLAVVAPGIAEALMATAAGLAAAIPAVIFYNHLARQTAAYRAIWSDLSESLMRRLSRDIDAGRITAIVKQV